MVVYHGGKRTTDASVLTAADVVLTTYSIVEVEHRKTQAPKVPCAYCGRKFFAERLKVRTHAWLHAWTQEGAAGYSCRRSVRRARRLHASL